MCDESRKGGGAATNQVHACMNSQRGHTHLAHKLQDGLGVLIGHVPGGSPTVLAVVRQLVPEAHVRNGVRVRNRGTPTSNHGPHAPCNGGRRNGGKRGGSNGCVRVCACVSGGGGTRGEPADTQAYI